MATDEVRVKVTVDTSEFAEAMRRMSIAARRVGWSLGNRGWQPRSWYATSERDS